jgi:polyphosphate glucokinase
MKILVIDVGGTHVKYVVGQMKAALEADYVVLGGGNARLLKKLPPGSELGDNANAFRGGLRLWSKSRSHNFPK